MEIKRKFEWQVVTHRRFVIRRSSTEKQIVCVECGEPMLATGQAASMFGITQRRIFQTIENDATHYAETESGAVMICLSSLAKFLDEEREKL
jgi:hypothetical protein